MLRGARAQAARSPRSRWSAAALVLCAVLLSGCVAAVWEDARSETIYPAMAERLHEKANAMCFVARSVNFRVVHASEIVTA